MAFVSDWAGNDDIYLFDLASGAIVRLAGGIGEERDPAFSPDGRSLSYRTNEGGAWAYVRYDLASGEQSVLYEGGIGGYLGALACRPQDPVRCVYAAYRGENPDLYLRTADAERRLTSDPAGDYAPAWRPGRDEIAFVSWREGQKDLYLVDAIGAQAVRLSGTGGDETSPAWHPDGDRLVYVYRADRDTDLYLLHLATGETSRLTDDPYPDRAPAYGPDGTLYWTRYAPGAPFERHDPYRAGRWALWIRPPGGEAQRVDLPIPGLDVYTPAAAFALWPDLPPLVSADAPEREATPTGGRAELVPVDVAVAGNGPKLNERVVPSYEAWRAEALAQTGWDVLGEVSDMFRGLGYSKRDYGHLSWHRTGRAVDLLFEWPVSPEGENGLMVVRDDLGAQTYWRLYLRTRAQDGSMGEPLTEAPFVFWFSLDPAREPEAWDAGGRPGAIPPGYYVDLTRLAQRHGWHRIASYEEPDFDWRTDSVGREFWHYQRTDGLTWWDAMLALYPLETLEATYGWSVCVNVLGMDPTWLSPKGIPTPVP